MAMEQESEKEEFEPIDVELSHIESDRWTLEQRLDMLALLVVKCIKNKQEKGVRHG